MIVTGPRFAVHDALGPRVVAIEASPFTIGRREGHHLQLAGAEVSRDHAEVITVGATVTIRDRESRYGTFVNGERITERRLAHGDRVQCGRIGTLLEFLIEAGPGDVSPNRFRPRTTAAADAAGRELRDAGHPVSSADAAPAVGDLRQVATLLDSLREMGSERVVDEVLTLVLDSAIAATGAERGFLMLADDAGVLELKLARIAGQLTVPVAGFETSRKVPEEVFATGETMVVADLLESGLAAVHTGTIALGIRQVLCAPLRLVRYVDRHEGTMARRNIGVLYLDSRERGRLLSPAARQALEALATEAATAIENARLYRGALEKARLDQELQTASRIQQALLPDARRTGPFFEAVGASIPSRAIGGDFFDYQARPHDRFGFGLGDVTGKGPPAALLTAMVQGALAAHAESDAAPHDLVALVNRVLLSRRIESRFVTLFLGMLSPDGRLSYCNAGQNPPVLLSSRGGALVVERLEVGGTLIGAFPGAAYDEAELQLSPGDTIVLFSDGVTDAQSADDDDFGDDRLIQVLTAAAGSPPEEMLRVLFEAVQQFSRGAVQYDDITAVVLRYLGPPSAA